MAAIKIHTPFYWLYKTANSRHKIGIWDELEAFADNNAINGTLWFKISLIAQVILFLLLPALLIFYYQVPFIILAVTLTLFFINIIDGMAGSGRRAITSVFAIAVIDLLMLALFVL
jgi:hypothetical protein